MPVDFFKDNCKTTSNFAEFGLCDDPHPNQEPAYIDETEEDKWIGLVDNSLRKMISFYAIDNCIHLVKPDGTDAKVCDGLLYFDNCLIFVELKSRRMKGSAWLKNGRSQLKSTINEFKSNNDISTYQKVEAYVCNSLKPNFNQGHSVQIQKFKDETGGLILRVQQRILI